MTATLVRLCQPAGYLPASGGKSRAACRCGYVTTPRTTEARALDALLSEHGYTGGDSCGICGADGGQGRPWERFAPLGDGVREVYVCKDKAGCSGRYEATRELDRMRCGCSHVTVPITGHYHPWGTS